MEKKKQILVGVGFLALCGVILAILFGTGWWKQYVTTPQAKAPFDTLKGLEARVARIEQSCCPEKKKAPVAKKESKKAPKPIVSVPAIKEQVLTASTPKPEAVVAAAAPKPETVTPAPELEAAAPAPKPEADVVVAAVASGVDYHKIVVRLWEGGDLAAVSGRQSRDLGVKLRADAEEGKLQPYPGNFTFKVEFRDLNFLWGRGKVVHINGEPQVLGDGFGPTQNTISVPVKDGIGYLTIPIGVITKDTAIIIHSPWRRPDLRYPPSGSLKTCAKSTANVCGGTVKEGEPSEFYQLVSEHEVSNYHFMK